MIKIFVLKTFKEYQQGSTYIVNENEAHSLIDGGYAEIYKDKVITNYFNKMMTSTVNKNNKIKLKK